MRTILALLLCVLIAGCAGLDVDYGASAQGTAKLPSEQGGAGKKAGPVKRTGKVVKNVATGKSTAVDSDTYVTVTKTLPF